jgi:hypothetical protein
MTDAASVTFVQTRGEVVIESNTYIKENDSLPDVEARLWITRERRRTPVDLDTALEVRFVAKRKGGTKVIQGTCEVADQTIDANLGKIIYRWQTLDTDTPGDYKVEFQVIWPGGKPQTFPSDGYDRLVIGDALG